MSRDTSFYYSFLVLPAAKRQAIVAVWDFCRAVDDAVDEPGGADAQVLLDGWRREIDHCFAGAPQTPQGTALQPLIARFGLPRRVCHSAVYPEFIAGPVAQATSPTFNPRLPGSPPYRSSGYA